MTTYNLTEQTAIQALETIRSLSLEDFCECDNTHAQNNTVCRPCFAAQIAHTPLEPVTRREKRNANL